MQQFKSLPLVPLLVNPLGEDAEPGIGGEAQKTENVIGGDDGGQSGKEKKDCNSETGIQLHGNQDGDNDRHEEHGDTE